MRLNLIPRDPAYFELFEQQAANVHAAAKELIDHLTNQPSPNGARTDSIHEFKERGQELWQQVAVHLSTHFVTPFDREDILDLSHELWRIIDSLETSAQRLAVYDIQQPNRYVLELSRIVLRCSEEIRESMPHLRRLKRKPLLAHCALLGQLERDADDVLHEALQDLFAIPGSDPLDVIKWKDIYEGLETATDRCSDVADTIRCIVVKYA